MKQDCVEAEKRYNTGYGRITVDGKEWLLHRWTWTQAHGPIPPGVVIRHKCDNPPCYNLEHLEPGTMKDNSEDMVKRNRVNPHQARKTHCPQNHEYTEENTYIPPNRKERQCRTCLRDRAREKYRAKNPGIKLRK